MEMNSLPLCIWKDKDLKLSDIQVSEQVQSRSEICRQTVSTYAAKINEGEMAPVLVFCDGFRYWLVDGFHRYQAAKLVNHTKISCRVAYGSKRDAILYAIAANIDNGFKRANADKRNGVETLLSDSEWSQWSNHEIARRCGVSHTYVRKLRLKLQESNEINPLIQTRQSVNRIAFRNGREYPIDVSNIGQLDR
ncbi:hypothetical protein C1752_10568 [Acaryochloris thomasi RCC1774]|uniref:ParB-like N-terminal domain-containing protein n=2 Tax=Acaryochloris TaxID=155977 RepID=A0A2W1JMQ6_9CYAN|nr:hypothetical protein C1752_10568 [Acaryochloris thomasi RCC1774]